MFTGLIEEVGTILEVATNAEGAKIRVAAQNVIQGVMLGDSIAIDGACMTVVAHDTDSFSVEVSPESLSKTHFSSFSAGTRVNLERPLTPASRIGGHYVTGHVDGLAKIVDRQIVGNSHIFTFEVQDPLLMPMLVHKGSVAILGISLTVNQVEGHRFTVAIIPHTLVHTTLGDYQIGQPVNIETDLLGKYVQRLLSAGQAHTPYNIAQPEAQSISLQRYDIPYTMDDPALVPAMDAFGLVAKPKTLTQSATTIRSGGWFNFHEEPDVN